MYKREREGYSAGVDIAQNGSLMSRQRDGGGNGDLRLKDYVMTNNKNIGYALHLSSTIVKYQYKV